MGGDPRVFPRLALLGLFFLLAAFLGGCHREPGPPPPLSTPKKEVPLLPKTAAKKETKGPQTTPLPETEFRGLSYVVYEDQALLWKVKAQEAQIYRGRRIDLQRVYVVSGDQGVSIKADQGVYLFGPKEFIFKGHVHLQTKRHGCLCTSRLIYLPEKRLLKTSAPVVIKNQGLIMEGKGLVYDLRTGTLKILHQTKVRVEG